MATVAIAPTKNKWRVLFAATFAPLVIALAGWVQLHYLTQSDIERENFESSLRNRMATLEELRKEGAHTVTLRNKYGGTREVPLSEPLVPATHLE